VRQNPASKTEPGRPAASIASFQLSSPPSNPPTDNGPRTGPNQALRKSPQRGFFVKSSQESLWAGAKIKNFFLERRPKRRGFAYKGRGGYVGGPLHKGCGFSARLFPFTSSEACLLAAQCKHPHSNAFKKQRNGKKLKKKKKTWKTLHRWHQRKSATPSRRPGPSPMSPKLVVSHY